MGTSIDEAARREGATDAEATPETQLDRAAERVERWRTRGWTTIVLEERGEEWRATQRGVDLEGRGETAASAAAAYCRRVDGDG